MKNTLRTFVAVEISQQIRARAVKLIAALGGAAAGVKWVEPENLHLTLKFLGEVRPAGNRRGLSGGRAGGGRGGPVRAGGPRDGAFPTAARPHTIWLGAGEGTQEMVTLHDRVEDALAELGHRKEHRRFQVHLTIGRVRGGGPERKGDRSNLPRPTFGRCPPEGCFAQIGPVPLSLLLRQQADFPAGRMHVEKVTVFSSTLTPAGAIYGVLGTARLGG